VLGLGGRVKDSGSAASTPGTFHGAWNYVTKPGTTGWFMPLFIYRSFADARSPLKDVNTQSLAFQMFVFEKPIPSSGHAFKKTLGKGQRCDDMSEKK
jgi:hypothetical protein